MDTVQGEDINIDLLQDLIIKNIEKKENLVLKNLNNPNDYNYSDANNNEYTGLVGNAEILEQQRRDLDNLIKDDERKNSIKIEEEKKIKTEVFKFLFYLI